MADRPAAAPRVLFGSFDAERSWAGPGPSALPALGPGPGTLALASADELLLQLCGPGDLLLTNRRMPPELLEDLGPAEAGVTVLTVPGDPAVPVETRLAAQNSIDARGFTPAPYAVVAETHAAVAALGVSAPLPDFDAVRTVNSKTWSNEFCLDHDIEGGARCVDSADDLEREVRALGYPVVLKTAHGVAGRGSLIVTGEPMLGAVARHLRGHGEAGGDRLLVQRRYERAADFSAHFDVLDSGDIGPVSFRGMTNNGLSFASSDTLDEQLEDRLRDDAEYGRVLAALGKSLRAAGYWGPVCVDALLAVDGTLVPVLDVNARLSMGRVGLHLDAAAPARMTRLSFVNLPCAGEPLDTYHRIREAVAAAGLEASVRLLTVSTLQAPVGRCYYALHADSAAELGRTDARLREVLATCRGKVS